MALPWQQVIPLTPHFPESLFYNPPPPPRPPPPNKKKLHTHTHTHTHTHQKNMNRVKAWFLQKKKMYMYARNGSASGKKLLCLSCYLRTPVFDASTTTTEEQTRRSNTFVSCNWFKNKTVNRFYLKLPLYLHFTALYLSGSLLG